MSESDTRTFEGSGIPESLDEHSNVARAIDSCEHVSRLRFPQIWFICVFKFSWNGFPFLIESKFGFQKFVRF